MRSLSVGVVVQDLELARARLLTRGERPSPAQQFQQVGFLCHLTDPAGFTIELLQQTFQVGLPASRPAFI